MKSTKEHREVFKSISDIAFSSGVNKSGIEIEKLRSGKLSKVENDLFFQSCNDGFKEAQKLIVDEILEYQNIYSNTTKSLKESRRNKNKEEIEELKEQLAIIETRTSAFSHIMDSIVWQLIGSQITTARRLNIQEKEAKSLINSNISHAIAFSEEVNENLNNIAIISDITNTVQIGDIIALRNKKIEIIELKEGKVNNEIQEFLNNIESKGEKFEDINIEEIFDTKKAKQIKRVVRQKTRMKRASTLIKEDEGIDPVSEEKMQIKTPSTLTEHYYDAFNDLISKLSSKNWAYGNIERCLHIGIYKNEALQMAPFTIKFLIEEETDNYILIDWMSISSNISEPLFTKPFPSDFIIDVLTGKTKVIMGLNLDLLIEYFNFLGLKTRWISRKETTKIKEKSKLKGMITSNNRGIEIEDANGEKIILFGGIISKILFDNIKPSNIARTLIESDNDK